MQEAEEAAIREMKRKAAIFGTAVPVLETDEAETLDDIKAGIISAFMGMHKNEKRKELLIADRKKRLEAADAAKKAGEDKKRAKAEGVRRALHGRKK